jgi:hypothetical protein
MPRGGESAIHFPHGARSMIVAEIEEIDGKDFDQITKLPNGKEKGREGFRRP